MRNVNALLVLGVALVIGGSSASAQSGGRRHIRVRKDVGANATAADTTASSGTANTAGQTATTGATGSNGFNGSNGFTGSNGVAGTNGMTDTTGGATAMSGGEVELPPAMSDANIIAHLASSDSLEIRMAQMALSQATDPRVRGLAQTMLTDHTQSLQQGLALAQQNGITPQPAPGDTAGQRMMRMMDRMSSMGGSMGARFDTMFVRRQVMMHQHMLNELQQLRGVAQSGAVRQQIDATIPVVQKHLDAAQQLAQTMGIDTSRMGSMRMRNMNGTGNMNDTTGTTGKKPPTF